MKGTHIFLFISNHIEMVYSTTKNNLRGPQLPICLWLKHHHIFRNISRWTKLKLIQKCLSSRLTLIMSSTVESSHSFQNNFMKMQFLELACQLNILALMMLKQESKFTNLSKINMPLSNKS
jgi:hypothetical protein